jgi:hypothetical protein
MEPLIRPKERAAAIALQIERELARVKDRDHGCWDDQVEVCVFQTSHFISFEDAFRIPINPNRFLLLSDISDLFLSQCRLYPEINLIHAQQ